MTNPASDCQVTWGEFYFGVECEAASAARAGRELAWTYEVPNVAVAVVDQAGAWAYAVAKEGR